eukprot:s101_g36.t3
MEAFTVSGSGDLSEPVDLPAELWFRLCEAEKDLAFAVERCEAIRREKERGRHIRARKTEEAEDDLYSASLHFVHVQRHLGVFVGEPSAEEARRALAQRAADAAATLLQLGSRVGLPSDVWRRIIRTALPLQSFGFEEGPKLRVSIPQFASECHAEASARTCVQPVHIRNPSRRSFPPCRERCWPSMAPKKGKPSVSASRSPTPTAAGSGAAAVNAKTKGAAKAKGKAKAKAKAAPSPEETAAVRLQSLARGFLARRAARRLHAERLRQDAELAAVVRAAELAALQVERRKAEAERAKQEEKRKKAQKLLADTKAAGGSLGNWNPSLPVDAADAAGITALSEAAAAGKAETAQLLLDRKANPNTRGEFSRTPLWRAAYSRQSDLVPLLLEAGGDPRLRDDDGQTPADVCAQDELCELLAAWDVSRTDELVEDFQEWAAELQRQEQHRQREAMRSVEEAFEAAAKAYEAAQMILAKAKAQMRNREKEYGMKLAAGHKDAMEACASADAALQRAEADAASAQHDFDQAQRRRLAAAEAAGAEVATGPGRSVPVPELNNVLLRDLGERIAQGGRWPLVLDPGDIAQKLIQYSGSSLLNFFRSGDMEPERIRVALLTMLRGGGVLAVDLHNFGAGVGLDLLSQPFENVRENLFQDICSRALLQVPKGKRMPNFYDLVTKEERQERFKAQMFDDKMIARFKFMVLTSTELPHKDLLEHFDVIRVVHASA